MSTNELRQRQPIESTDPVTVTPAPPTAKAPAPASNSLLRLAALAIIAALGYLAYSAYSPTSERTFTLRQLSAYDGSNPDLPVYVSIGGEVYDVSGNRRVYGKGGSYNIMAGRDASRAFITGCFETHLTHDLRGLDAEELKKLDTWKDFFASSDKYPHVGHAVLPEFTESDPIPEMCANPKTA